MELEPDILREVLFKTRNGSLSSPVRTEGITLEGYESEVVGYHIYILALDDCFITHLPPQPLFVVGTRKWPNHVVYGLTAKGHDRLAILERSDLFAYIKEEAKKEGSSFIFSFGREMASSWLKNKMGMKEE